MTNKDYNRETYGEMYFSDPNSLPIPRSILSNPKYDNLQAIDFIVYTIYLSLDYQAYRENQVDKYGRPYIKADDEEIAELANASLEDVQEARIMLEQVELIEHSLVNDHQLITVLYPEDKNSKGENNEK